MTKKAFRQKCNLLGRSNDRRETECDWYTHPLGRLVRVHHIKDGKYGLAGTEVFRMIWDDCSQQRVSEVESVSKDAVDVFVKSIGLDPNDFRLDKSNKSKQYPFTTFEIEDTVMVREHEDKGMFHIEANLLNSGLDHPFVFKGPKCISQPGARTRFFNKFNRVFPKCHLRESSEVAED